MAASLGVFEPVPVLGRVRHVLGGLLVVLMTLGSVCAASLFWMPASLEYSVEHGDITVLARYSVITERREVPAAAIETMSIRRVGKGRRVSGVVLPDFCVGTFSFPHIGRVYQAGNCTRAGLVVRLRDGATPLLVTPLDWRGFRATVAARGSGRFTPRLPAPGQGWLLLRIGSLLPLALLPVVAALSFAAPGRLSYAVDPAGLRIRSLIRTRLFPGRGATVRSFRPASILRFWGSGLPGYYTGVFRLDGTSTRVYATRLDEGILVEGGGARVFVTPARAAAFIEALCRAGATAPDGTDG